MWLPRSGRPTRFTASGSLIDEIFCKGARRMLAAALEAKVSPYMTELADQTDGRAPSGGPQRAPPAPPVTTAAGPAYTGATFENGVLVEREEEAA